MSDLTFRTFIRPEMKIIEISGGLWEHTKLLSEMAKGKETVPKIEPLWDEADLEFLHQFPPKDLEFGDDLWTLALKWRYGEGLLRVSELWAKLGYTSRNPGPDYDEELKKAYPDRETVDLYRWDIGSRVVRSGEGEEAVEDDQPIEGDDQKEEPPRLLRIYRFENIRTGAVDLWERLQDPKGRDMDLTRGWRWKQRERDALHQFNSTAGVLQLETARRNLKAWLLGNEAGVFKHREDYHGVPTTVTDVQMGPEKSNVHKLPAVEARFEPYKVIMLFEKRRRGRQAGADKVAEREKDIAGRTVQNPTDLPLGPGEQILKTYLAGEKDRTGKVGAFKQWVPVLSPGNFLRPIKCNKKAEMCQIILGRDATFADLTKMFLIDPSERIPNLMAMAAKVNMAPNGQGRTARNLYIAMAANKEQLDLSDTWLEELNRFFAEAEYYRLKAQSETGLAARKQGRGRKSKEQLEAEKAYLNLANLYMALNPKYTKSAWISPAKMTKGQDGGEGRQFTAEHDPVNVLNNFYLLDDKAKKTLMDTPSTEEVIAAKKAGDKTDKFWVVGGFSMAKAQFQQVGYDTIRELFPDDEDRAAIEQYHRQLAYEIIQGVLRDGFISGGGGKMVKLKNSQMDILKQSDTDWATDIARQAILDKKYVKSAQIDESGNFTNRDQFLYPEEGKRYPTIMAKSRIRELLSIYLDHVLRYGATSYSADISGEEGKSTSIDQTMAGGAGPASGHTKERQFRRKVSTGVESGEANYGTQRAIEDDIERLFSRKDEALALRNEIIRNLGFGKEANPTSNTELMRQFYKEFTSRFKSEKGFEWRWGLGAHSLYKALEMMDDGAEIEDIKKQMVGTQIDAPRTMRPAITFDQVESLDDYVPANEMEVINQPWFQGIRKALMRLEILDRNLEFEPQEAELDIVRFDDKISELQSKGEQAKAEKYVITWLHEIKQFMANNAVPLEKMKEYWPKICEKLKVLLEPDEEEEEGEEEEEEAPAPTPPPPTPPAPAAPQAAPASPSATTAGAIDPQHQTYYNKIMAFYDIAKSAKPEDSQKLKAALSNPDNIRRLRAMATIIGKTFPEAANKLNLILSRARSMGINTDNVNPTVAQEWTGVPMGYPPYNKVKKFLKQNKINAWGAAGADYTATPDEGPIQPKKKKSLQEYLTESKLLPYRKRLEERVKNAKLDR